MAPGIDSDNDREIVSENITKQSKFVLSSSTDYNSPKFNQSRGIKRNKSSELNSQESIYEVYKKTKLLSKKRKNVASIENIPDSGTHGVGLPPQSENITYRFQNSECHAKRENDTSPISCLKEIIKQESSGEIDIRAEQDIKFENAGNSVSVNVQINKSQKNVGLLKNDKDSFHLDTDEELDESLVSVLDEVEKSLILQENKDEDEVELYGRPLKASTPSKTSSVKTESSKVHRNSESGIGIVNERLKKTEPDVSVPFKNGSGADVATLKKDKFSPSIKRSPNKFFGKGSKEWNERVQSSQTSSSPKKRSRRGKVSSPAKRKLDMSNNNFRIDTRPIPSTSKSDISQYFVQTNEVSGNYTGVRVDPQPLTWNDDEVFLKKSGIEDVIVIDTDSDATTSDIDIFNLDPRTESQLKAEFLLKNKKESKQPSFKNTTSLKEDAEEPNVDELQCNSVTTKTTLLSSQMNCSSKEEQNNSQNESVQSQECYENRLTDSKWYSKLFETVLATISSEEKNVTSVGTSVEPYLFDDSDCAVLGKLFVSGEFPRCLYFRLLTKNHEWIFKNRIVYPDLIGNLDEHLKILQTNGFVTLDPSNEEILVLLNLLSVQQLKKLCGDFHQPRIGKKKDLISALLNMYSSQTTLTSTGSASGDRYRGLRLAVLKTLGDVVKLCGEERKKVLQYVRMFSFTYNFKVGKEAATEIVERAMVDRVNYPKYNVKTVPVFYSKENFQEYEDSLQLRNDVDLEEQNKRWPAVIKLVREARERFINIINSPEKMELLRRMPDFMRRYTAANSYASTIFHHIKALKKDKKNDDQISDAIRFLKELLKQELFLVNKRGGIYDELVRLLRQKKLFSEAFGYFQKARQDKLTTHLAHHKLYDQMLMIVGRKTVMKDLKEAINKINFKGISLDSIQPITVYAKVVEISEKHRKRVYVTEYDDCKKYESVEEVVISDFKKTGWVGVHDEGKLLKSIVIALFWDVIFGDTRLENEDTSVFVYKFQTKPLDWGTTGFYQRREAAIGARLEEIEKGDLESVFGLIEKCNREHRNETFEVNIWNWISDEKLTLVKNALRCMSVRFVAAVARWLLKDFKTYSSGFPDLTLWNTNKNKCLFLEVKGPGDTLASNQKLWIQKIRSFGGDSNICHVKDTGSLAGRAKVEDS